VTRLSFSKVTSPANGTVTREYRRLLQLHAERAVLRYRQAFTFKANDGTVDSNTAKVSITVTPRETTRRSPAPVC